MSLSIPSPCARARARARALSHANDPPTHATSPHSTPQALADLIPPVPSMAACFPYLGRHKFYDQYLYGPLQRVRMNIVQLPRTSIELWQTCTSVLAIVINLIICLLHSDHHMACPAPALRPQPVQRIPGPGLRLRGREQSCHSRPAGPVSSVSNQPRAMCHSVIPAPVTHRTR